MSSFEQQEIASLRQRISRLEAQIDQVYRHLGITFHDNAEAGDNPELIAELKRNNIIGAIKIYREMTGLGLAEAKTAVESIRARRGL